MASVLTITSVIGLELIDHRLATQYEAMTAQIRQRLSLDHAFLFTRPEPALEAERLAWFTEGDESGAPMSGLSEEDRARIQLRLQALEADLRTLIVELDQGGPSQKALASLIENALVRPSADAVWAVADRPVLVNWGFREAGRQATSRSAVAIVAEAYVSRSLSIPVVLPEDPGTPTPELPARDRVPFSNAFLWGLFVVLLGFSARQLLPACGLFGTEMPAILRRISADICPAPTRSDGLADALAALKTSIAEDESSLIAKALDCRTCSTPLSPTPAPVITPPPPQPTPLPLPERTKRGKLEISLIWSGETDLDLIVACPNGTKLAQDRLNKYNCGGEFVVDMNHAEKRSRTPIEHVIWEREEDASPGPYSIQVNPYDTNGQRVTAVPFEIVISRDGQPVKSQFGTARRFSPIELIDVLTVTFPLQADGPRANHAGGRP